MNEDGSVQPGHSIIYYQLFSTTDLLNWKHHNPVYSGKPQATTDLLECIFYTHQPTWDDCGQFLMSLFTTEERWHISTEAQEWLWEQASTEVLGVEGLAWEVMPEMRPNWDFNTREGQETLGHYQDAFLLGLQLGATKPTNMSKNTIIQKVDETLINFHERLYEAF